MNWLVKANVCPGLFYGTPAQDGFLIRIRTPGGWLNAQQGELIAQLLKAWGSETLQVTNRGNLQIRAVQTSPSLEVFQTLQNLGLAASDPRIDHLRNIMASPTAGIDRQELIDTRPLVQKLDNFIQNHPSIIELSPKFSIGIDGGGMLGIGTRSPMAWEHRYNEIQLSSIAINNINSTPDIYFQLSLGGDKNLYHTSILIEPKHCLSVVAALIKVYIDYVQQNPSPTGKKPRMKHLLKDWGVEKYIEAVKTELEYPLEQIIDAENTVLETLNPLPSQPYAHLGIHPQKQAGLSYLGLSLKLGKLSIDQLLELVEISKTFGSDQLRLTPWQTILIPDIPDEKIAELLPKLAPFGLSNSLVDAGIVACAGKPGCAAAATETQIHALILGDYLKERLTLNSPVNIHVTGCNKLCAQPSPAEITLLGTTIEQNGKKVEGYQVYIGKGQASLNHQVCEGKLVDILPLIQKICVDLNQDLRT
ncbi:MAG: precorrin-3B synthase [Oscillatoriales cyanobacterium CG2_30_40_61]|nr:MAG: precorrin-3B synthase [Oscillatoriales cyanobacterium CG2_30_40_61]